MCVSEGVRNSINKLSQCATEFKIVHRFLLRIKIMRFSYRENVIFRRSRSLVRNLNLIVVVDEDQNRSNVAVLKHRSSYFIVNWRFVSYSDRKYLAVGEMLFFFICSAVCFVVRN